jgi:ceramide glucosyltransferase
VSLFEKILVGIVIFSAIYWAISTILWRNFLKKSRPIDPKFAPPVSILVPLHGAEPHLRENLAALCAQNYENCEILCGVADERDPAAEIAREFPKISLKICSEQRGLVEKINTLSQLLQHAKHEIIVLCDSDVRFSPDFLRNFVQPLAENRVGLVTALYKIVGAKNPAARLNAATFNAEFVPSALLAMKLQGRNFALGAAIATRKSVLAQIGGLRPFENFIGNDNLLGRAVAKSGHEIALGWPIAEIPESVLSWREWRTRQLRLARTCRALQPVGWFFSIITHGTSAALILTLLDCKFWPILAGAILLRAILARQNPPVIVARDVFGTIFWALSFCGGKIVWRGRKFRVRNGGKLEQITP